MSLVSDVALNVDPAGQVKEPVSQVPDATNLLQSKGRLSKAQSRINRNGLTDGTVAPGFSLPGLAGRSVSLEEFRGRRILLVFSDPNCGPCNLLAPRLEGLSRRTPDIQVIMVSRGDPEANKAKATEHNLTFPVLLQRRWEVSLLYAMFATPIAYYIDQEGVIRGNIAVGAEQILRLLVAAAIKSLLETIPQ